MRVEADGRYRPIWCSREYTEMMEGTQEECIRYEGGSNNLTIRKLTVKGNLIWVCIHYAFLEDEGVQYAYCTYFDVTELKESQQYDMVTYLVSGYYGVAIGDAANILRGSIFHKKRDGVYMDYIREQVIPVVPEAERESTLAALSLETVEQELARSEPYTVDVAIEIGGEVFNKRFMFYTVDREKHFYILLKSDMTDVLREQRERNELLDNALRDAEQANVAKTAFLSSMSHEIRTPMNAIIGLDSIALKEPNLPARTREQLEKIGGSAKHLLGLINDILDMSRIESGRMTLKNEEFSFREMLEQINTMIHGQCEDRDSPMTAALWAMWMTSTSATI